MGAPGRVVRVAVDALADRPERTFSYRLPAELGDPAPGSLLLVPYGHRLALGYLMPDSADGAVPVDAELRDVEAVVSGPMLTDDLLALAVEIAVYYRAPVGTTLAAMLPPGLESRVERRWTVESADQLSPEMAVGLEAAAGADGSVADAALLRLGPARGRDRWLAGLRRRGAVRPTWSLRPPEVRAQRVRVLRPVAGAHELPPRAPLQRALLEAIGDGERTLPEL
ncbi:MAG TPA: hypothetical protein VK736_09710, partial [Candidatus Binatia bacterium]|nr:hypothetical protein [Candidatus Binatia bacterium]